MNLKKMEIQDGHLIAEFDDMSKVDLGQVVGATGATGPAGTAATVTVGTVTTGAAGSSATVTNSGTSNAAVLNFAIPRGATGAKGDTGATGAAGKDGITPTFSIEDGHLYADYDTPYTG